MCIYNYSNLGLEATRVPVCSRNIIVFSHRVAGSYEFEVTIADSATKPCAHVYNSEKKLLYIKKGMKFAVLFNIGFPPPPDTIISAMVCCAKPEDVKKFGPVKRCMKHSHKDGG